jgi:hypothetical protein
MKSPKKTGRPPKVRIQIPLAAQKRIEDLSAKSGMRIEWITEYALKVGLLATYNKLMPIIRTDEEINKTWEEVDAPGDDERDVKSAEENELIGADDPKCDSRYSSEQGEAGSTQDGLGDDTVERGLLSEVPEVTDDSGVIPNGAAMVDQ